MLGEKDKKGATKKKVYTIPPKNTTSTPTASQGRTSALKPRTKNNTIYTQELMIALKAMVDLPDISKEDKERVLLKIGSSLPFIFLFQKEVREVTVADLCCVGNSAGVRDCRRLHELGQSRSIFDVCMHSPMKL